MTVCAGEATRHGSMSISEGQSRAFVDCWFTLAALDADPELQKHMRNVIRKAGGRIFDAGRLNLVTNTGGAYAVCPFGFPAQARREAMRHADFKKGELYAELEHQTSTPQNAAISAARLLQQVLPHCLCHVSMYLHCITVSLHESCHTWLPQASWCFANRVSAV